MGIPSATDQPTTPTQPFILSRSINKYDVVPSAEYLRGEGLVWLIGAVVCLLATAAGPMSVSAGQWIGHIAAATLALANQLPLPRL